MEKDYICKFCRKVCKNANSHRNHERLCPSNPNRNYVSHTISHKAWNKGLTKENDERIRKYGETCSKRIQSGIIQKSFKGKHHTEEYKQRMRELAFERQLGGWHTSKTIDYKGIKLDSQYEFEVAKELDNNQVKWERPTYFLWEDSNGMKHRYYPDFYLPEYNVYLDPKNDYLINNKSKRFGITDVEKIEKVEQQNGIKIILLDKDNLTWESIKEKI